MAKTKTYYKKNEGSKRADQNPSKKNADANIRKNILINGKAFEDLLSAHNCASAIGYFGVCLIMTFLLMTLSLFCIYHFLDESPLNLSLDYALFDSMLGTLMTGVGFMLFQVLPTHAAARILGAKKSLSHTFQVHSYAYTPYFLIGWVWLLGGNGSALEMALLAVGILFTIFALINGVIGLRAIHGLSTFRAVIAEFVVPFLVYAVFGIFVAMYGTKLGLV